MRYRVILPKSLGFEMTPEETTSEEKSSRSCWGFVLWPFVILVLYALSAGPAMLAAHRLVISWKVVDAIYSPLQLSLDATHLWKPYCMYLHLWCPTLFDKNGNLVVPEAKKA